MAGRSGELGVARFARALPVTPRLAFAGHAAGRRTRPSGGNAIGNQRHGDARGRIGHRGRQRSEP